MGGGPGMGGDSFTDFTTGRAGHHRTPPPPHEGRDRVSTRSQLGGIGGYTLAVALLLLVVALLVFLLL